MEQKWTIQVTEHARVRMMERIKVKSEKVQKLAEKAWATRGLTNEYARKKFMRKIYANEYWYKNPGAYKFREIMGYVFIYKYHGPFVVRLITVV